MHRREMSARTALARRGTTRPSARALSRRGPRREYHHGDLRAALLDSIGRIIRERGLAFVSIREVARRARVSHAAPAHHFRNKSGLLTAFAVQGFDRLADTIAATIQASHASTPPAILAAMGRGYVRFAVANPEHFSIMFRHELIEAADPELVRASDRAYGGLVATVRAAADEGSLDADDHATTTVAAWSLAHGLASLWLSGRLHERLPTSDVHELADAVTGLFVARVMRRR